MKREDILFYMSEGKIHTFLVHSKREKVFDLDTSLFFKFGEISNVSMCEARVTEVLTKMKLGEFILKPNIIVLYNDICYSDTKFLYKVIFEEFGYNSIKFARLSRLAKLICNQDNVVVFDKNYYSLIDRGEKCTMEETIGFDPIIIGKRHSEHVHYPEEDIVWRTFISCFTNSDIYDNMDVGGDEV